jgi:hypothetical protein
MSSRVWEETAGEATDESIIVHLCCCQPMSLSSTCEPVLLSTCIPSIKSPNNKRDQTAHHTKLLDSLQHYHTQTRRALLGNLRCIDVDDHTTMVNDLLYVLCKTFVVFINKKKVFFLLDIMIKLESLLVREWKLRVDSLVPVSL